MFKIFGVVFLLCLTQLSFGKPNLPTKVDTTKKQTTQNTTAGQKQQQQTDTTKVNTLSIDTNKTIQQQVVPPVVIDTVKKVDSILTAPVSENTLTNTKLFIYILLSAGGLGFFFFHICADTFQIVSQKTFYQAVTSAKLEFVFCRFYHLDFYNLGTCSRVLDIICLHGCDDFSVYNKSHYDYNSY